MKEEITLPGEGPSILGRCNYDTLSPKRRGRRKIRDRDDGLQKKPW